MNFNDSCNNSLSNIDNRVHNINDLNVLENVYSEWSKTYDEEMLKPDSYNGFIIISKIMDLFSYRNKSRRILDVGAGTGLVAEELRKMGYINIDALEPNEAMVSVAKQKNLYNNYFKEYIKVDEPVDSIADNTYDRITAAGVFSQGHMDYRHIKQVLKLLKPGGFLIFGFRHSYVDGLQKEVVPEIIRLESEKTVKIRLMNEIPDYYPGVSGFMAVLEKI